MSESKNSPGCMAYFVICIIITVVVVGVFKMKSSIETTFTIMIVGLFVFLIYYGIRMSPTPKKSIKMPDNNPAQRYAYTIESLAISNFFLSLERDSEFMHFLYNNVNGLQALDQALSDEVIPGHDNRLAILLFSDFTKASTKMGHLFTFQRDENILLETALLNLHDVGPHAIPEKMFNAARKVLASIANISCRAVLDKDDFAIAAILERAEMPATAHRYRQLIFNYCEQIACQDRTITDIEKEYLEGFKRELSKAESPTADAHRDIKENEADALSRLDDLTGLMNVKTEIGQLANFIKVQQMRRDKGMKTTPVSYHCVFTGNPGTGKTTVARIVADVYRELGILKRGHLVETDRSGLVAEYVGQTAVKTNKKIDEAIDGVLFIDEAYSLVPTRENNDYGYEAIATLLKRMEDDRDRLVVILAGYNDEMRRFIESNPGLKSRFNRYIDFEDYDAESLCKIFLRLADKNEYILNADAQATLHTTIESLVKTKDRHFGNARTIRNLFEKAIERQAHRLAKSSPDNLISTDLQTLTPADIEG